MKAWLKSRHTQIYNVTDKARGHIEHPADDASLAVWLVHAPWMHPLWCWHYAGLIHLRDLPGQSKPPYIAFAGATHELDVFAIDPDHPPNVDKLESLHFLEPVSIVQQFKAENDAAALARIEHLLGHCVEGKLTLDSDGRRAWRVLLGSPELPEKWL